MQSQSFTSIFIASHGKEISSNRVETQVVQSVPIRDHDLGAAT